MDRSIKKIHLSIEKKGIQAIDYENENTDVIVELCNGDIYAAAFITYKNLQVLIDQHKRMGTYLNGKYFWVERMVLLDNITENNVRLVIEDLISEGNFHTAFRKL